MLELHGTVTQDGAAHGKPRHLPPLKAKNRLGSGLFRPSRNRSKRPGEPFRVMNCGGQEALLAHVLNAEHASKAQAMVFFGLRKGALDCFFAPGINPRSVSGSSCISSAAISGTSRTSCVSLIMIDG